MIRWQEVSTVLLDMDGTLLDLHYDNYFWLEHVPQRFAERHGLALPEAKAMLIERYRQVEGRLEWYCVDFWTRELGLDIAALKHELRHLVRVHPHVSEFLRAVRAGGRRAWLVTNAHRKVMALKMAHTRLGHHFDATVSAHDLGAPKEDLRFWQRLHVRAPFERTAALLIDDSLPVLRAAETYGIGQLLAVRHPDSRGPMKESGEFAALSNFREILPDGQAGLGERARAAER